MENFRALIFVYNIYLVFLNILTFIFNFLKYFVQTIISLKFCYSHYDGWRNTSRDMTRQQRHSHDMTFLFYIIKLNKDELIGL